MKEKKWIKLEVEKQTARALINCLLCSPDVEKDMNILKTRMLYDSFLEAFNITLNDCLKANIYGVEAYENMEKILKYLKSIYEEIKDKTNYIENIDNYYILLGKYTEAKNNTGYEIYQDEFNSKMNSIQEHNLNKPYLWNKKDMDLSIRFDYDILFSSKIDDENYLSEYLNQYVFNQKYIYFIKKMLVSGPIVFLDKRINARAIDVLNYNEDTYYETDKKTLVEKYALKNYGVIINDNEEFEKYNKVLDEFIRDCKNLKIKLLNINEKNYFNNFQKEIFVDYYQKALLEKLVVANGLEIINPENTMQLEYLYKLIEDNKKTKICNVKMKNSIIEMMNLFKENYKLNDKKEFIHRYNEYLGLLNETEPDAYGMVNNLVISKLSYLESMKIDLMFSLTGDPSEYDELVDTLKLDYQILNSFLWDEKKYSEYEIHFVSSAEYAQSINKFFNEFPIMFDNKIIFNRVTSVLNKKIKEYEDDEIKQGSFYREDTKILKKINKYYSKEDKK